MNKGRGTPHKDADDNSDSLIDEAEKALRDFAGDDMTGVEALVLIPLWRNGAALMPRQKQAVVGRFPDGDARITDETIDALWRINERITDVEQRARRAYAHGYVDALTGRTDGYQRLGGVRHAWTLDRDEPTESFYWTCSCGHVVVQSFGTPAPDELLAHVIEQQG